MYSSHNQLRAPFCWSLHIVAGFVKLDQHDKGGHNTYVCSLLCTHNPYYAQQLPSLELIYQSLSHLRYIWAYKITSSVDIWSYETYSPSSVCVLIWLTSSVCILANAHTCTLYMYMHVCVYWPMHTHVHCTCTCMCVYTGQCTHMYTVHVHACVCILVYN